jgi:wobble nucleotide-excising tRNase
MRGFEEKMRVLERKIPNIDETKIRAIEQKAKELEKVLTEIASTF